ncbi:protein DBF4 homolog A isoform X2 [Ornithorhynchus anatinus]|uniref:protein DBF4 homolog A isoform X2 n=1 Tax=Ornithorhynchus anatinus TaxID=9258 RepID=UPI0010A793F6|nr:protein DBF4 homolog A isoform X2 [Ornithorhynchus anatinus]
MRIGPDSHLPARKVQGKNEKSKPFLKMMKNDANKQEKLKYKPLWGKVFYLDLPSILTAEKLEMDLKELGGRVEEFLSRDISYLISSKKEAKFAQMFGRISPVPSPESAYTGGNSSPDPSYDGNSVKTLDAVCVSRGKLLVEKAIKEQDFITPNSILSNALSWGVKILHLDDIKCYIEQKKKELCLIKKSSSSVREEDRLLGNRKTKRRLKKPFVKVEDVKRHYRPFYLQLADTPLLNYSTSKPCSPFDADKTTCVQKPTQAKLRNRADGGLLAPVPLKEKKKKGYCECCLQKYEDLQTHLVSEQHRKFAQSTRYQVVDDIISKLVYDFVEFRSDEPRRESIQSTLKYFVPTLGNLLRKGEDQVESQKVSQSGLWRPVPAPLRKQDFGDTEDAPSSSVKFGVTAEPLSSTVKFKKNFDSGQACLVRAAKKAVVPSFVQLHHPEENPGTKGPSFESPEQKDCESRDRGFCACIVNTSAQVSALNESHLILSQMKRKSGEILFPGKTLKKMNLNSSFTLSHEDKNPLREESQRPLTASTTPGMVNQDPKEFGFPSTDSLPLEELWEKAEGHLGRSKETRQRKVAGSHGSDRLPGAEGERTVLSSKKQSLLELFQTSEKNSDFGGFTDFSKNSDSYVWEGENNLVPVFLSSSTSTFPGF